MRAPRKRPSLVAASWCAVLAAGCGSEPPPPPAACGAAEVLVAASDYTSSALGGARGRGPQELRTGFDLGKDPQLVESSGRFFFVARDNDLVFELDACGVPVGKTSLAGAAGAGASNPHDVAVAPDGSLWVTLYNRAVIAIAREGAVRETIDLSAYDDDRNPQADAIRILEVGGRAKAFVTLERLDDKDRLRSTRPSQVLVVDVATRAPEGVIALAGRNPFNRLSARGARLFVAAPGNFDDAREPAAGVEVIDTGARTTSLLLRETDLGGSPSEIAVGERCAAAIVAGPQKDVNPTWVVTFSPDTGALSTTAAAPLLGPTAGFDLQGLAWRGDRLYVGDRRRGARGHAVHVFRLTGDGCALAPAGDPIELPLPPVGLR